jgi:hypothetical protein
MDAGKVRQGWTMLGAEQVKLVGVPREYTIMGNQNTTMMDMSRLNSKGCQKGGLGSM